jgi:hypothetical protein
MMSVPMNTLSGIRRAMAGLRHDSFGRVYVHMLKAFVDDSGSGGDSPWYVLAGYVGTVESWDAFDGPWREVLNGPPKLEYFKASEAESLRADGQWAGITKDERNQRLDAFIKVVGSHALRAIYVQVKQQDYNEIIKPYVPPEWDHAYYFLFTGIIAGVTSIEKYAGISRPVEFFFDSTDKQLKKRSKMLYGQVDDLPQFGHRVINIHYEDEKEFLPLQAADLLAWQIRRRFCVQEEPRPQCDSALACTPEPPFHHTITRDELDRLGRTMDENAMMKWALMGLPEHRRPWRRPSSWTTRLNSMQ